MTDFNKPTTTDRYDTLILPEIKARDISAAKMDFSGDTNTPANAVSFTPWSKTSHAGHYLSREIRLETPGTISMLGTSRVPDGWLLCDGATLNQTDYADLYAEIGTTFGAAGAGTFKVPDMRQRFPLGKADSGTGSTLGINGIDGAINHQHTGASHQHTFVHTHLLPKHFHSTNGTGCALTAAGQTLTGSMPLTGVAGVFNTGAPDGSHTHSWSGSTSHTHGQVVTANDGGSAYRRDFNSDGVNNTTWLPSGEYTYFNTINMTVDNDTIHTHGARGLLGYISHSHGVSGVSGNIGNYSSAKNGGTDLNLTVQSASGTSFDANGAGITGSANPPLLSLNFIIKT